MDNNIINKKLVLPLISLAIALIIINIYAMYKFGQKYDSPTISSVKEYKK